MAAFLFERRASVNIYVYGDESGTFDKAHNDWFVFGGLIFLSKEQRDVASRMYSRAEKAIRSQYPGAAELKATHLSNKHKGGLFRSTNGMIRYAIIIEQKKVHDGAFSHKKTSQRYLDYAYKVGLKRVFEKLMKEGTIVADEVKDIIVYFDQHLTATDGLYELREGMEQEFKHGTVNFRCNTFHKPIFPNMGSLELMYKDSRSSLLIRASDIVSNRAFNYARSGNILGFRDKAVIVLFP